MTVRVTYMQRDGASTQVTGAEGASVMETAIEGGVEGIVAACGGNMMCATCHVYVDEPWLARLAQVDEAQDQMLDETAAERRPNSRLSCQIRLSPQLDGLVVHVPDIQQ